MKLDNISKPKLLWYEDSNGRRIDSPEPEKSDTYQFRMNLSVTSEVLGDYKKPKWPIRFLKWLIDKMPVSWHGRERLVYKDRASINGAFPIIKYLVEVRNWDLNSSAAVYANMCERCANICIAETAGKRATNLANNTHCKYCKEIDPEYDSMYKIKNCYRAFKLGSNVREAWKEFSL